MLSDGQNILARGSIIVGLSHNLRKGGKIRKSITFFRVGKISGGNSPEREMENQRSLRVKQAALRWQRRELAAIFHSWRNNIDEIIQNRVLVNRFLLKYNKRHEHAAFSTWYKKIQDRINARKYFKK